MHQCFEFFYFGGESFEMLIVKRFLQLFGYLIKGAEFI